jgi:hypothetical protein
MHIVNFKGSVVVNGSSCAYASPVLQSRIDLFTSDHNFYGSCSGETARRVLEQGESERAMMGRDYGASRLQRSKATRFPRTYFTLSRSPINIPAQWCHFMMIRSVLQP